MDQELAKRLKEHPDFRKFSNYVLSQIEKLDSVQGLEALTDEQAGEEAKIRLKTTKLLHEILKPFLYIPEERKTSVEQVQKTKSKYAL